MNRDRGCGSYAVSDRDAVPYARWWYCNSIDILLFSSPKFNIRALKRQINLSCGYWLDTIQESKFKCADDHGKKFGSKLAGSFSFRLSTGCLKTTHTIL